MKIKHPLTATLSSISLALMALHAQAADVTNGFTTENGRIVKVSNSQKQAIQLQGINWFGFNTPNYALHGLWGGQSGNYVTSQYNTDLRTMIDRIKGLGFNAVRLPFVFDFITNPNGTYPNMQENSNCPYSPNKDEASKPNPNAALNGTGCNLDFKKSGYEQNAFGFFKYTVDQFTKNGIYVLLDDHYEENLYPNDANKTAWVEAWKKVAETFKNNPYVIGYDLFNEPDSKGLQWPVWGPNAVAAAQAIYAISPNKLIFIEGTGQGSFGANWGTGFKITEMNYTDNRNPMQYLFDPLFQYDKQKPGFLNQIVISPHVYGMDGTNGGASPTLYDNIQNYDKIFGYLNKSGVCTAINGAQQCHLFPIAIGELGATFGQYKSPYTADGDERMMNILGAYMMNKNVAANSSDPDVIAQKKYNVKQDANGLTANHNPIYDYFYWSWNPNSGNTGGILGSYQPESSSLDQSNWTDIVWKKVNYLSLFLGLNGSTGDGGGTTPPEPGQLCLVVNKDETNAPGLLESNFEPITVQGSGTTITLKPVAFNTPVCDSVPAGSYTVNESILYGTTLQYDSQKQAAEVTEGAKTTSTVKYIGTPIKNVDLRVNGLSGTQKSTVTLKDPVTLKTYKFTLSPTQDMVLTHVDPGTYNVTATAITNMTTQITPNKVTVNSGKFKASILVSYIAKAGNAACTIQFKEQGGAPNQWYPNAQYTFKTTVSNLSSSTATSNWKLYFQFGSDVIGLENFWNMQKPASLNKIPGSADPYSFEVIPQASWQAFGPSNPIEFDQIGYIEKLNWRDGFTTGVNTIPTKVTLTINGQLINCTASLVSR